MSLRFNVTGFAEAIGALQPVEVERAHLRARRTGAARAQTQLSREVRQGIPIGTAAIKQALRLVPPRADAPGYLTVVSPSTPISELRGYRLLKKGGVSVNVAPGKRLRIIEAFQIPNAGRRAFVRDGTFRKPAKGRYAGRNVLRENIQQLFTRSVTQVADDQPVIDSTLQVYTDAADRELLRQLALIQGRAG